MLIQIIKITLCRLVLWVQLQMLLCSVFGCSFLSIVKYFVRMTFICNVSPLFTVNKNCFRNKMFADVVKAVHFLHKFLNKNEHLFLFLPNSAVAEWFAFVVSQKEDLQLLRKVMIF